MHQQLKYVFCHNAASATANGTALDVTEAQDLAFDVAAFQLSGTYSATVTFEGTVDGSNWVSVPFVNGASGVVATTATANGVYRGFVAGFTQIRARLTWTSGTSITVVGQLVQGSANSLYGALAAAENVIGIVGGTTLMPTVTFSLDTSAYTANDLLADTQAVAGALRVSGGSGVLNSIAILDEDDQAAAGMTVYILKSNVSLGSENSGITVTDANAREIIGVINIAAGDWTDLINSKLAFKGNLGIPIKVSSGTSIWIALQTAGTPTQTASGITGILGILAD